MSATSLHGRASEAAASTQPGLVSTIIPVHNRPDMLSEAIESVLTQTYRPIEIIIVDDGSTDATPAVADEIAGKRPEIIRVIHQPNAGAGAARNTGLAQARGEYIEFLDSDDLLLPEKFARQVEDLQRNPQAGVSYCITLRPAGGRGERPWAATGESFDSILPRWLLQRGWATLTPLWRRTACDSIGPWQPFRVMEDWDYDCRAGLAGVRPLHCPHVLAVVRDHEEQRACGREFTMDVTRGYFLAHRSIFQRLPREILLDTSTMRPFSRKLFWIARMCGERGLRAEAAEAYGMALAAARAHGGTLGMRCFRGLTRVAGWPAAVRLGEAVRRLARRQPAHPGTVLAP